MKFPNYIYDKILNNLIIYYLSNKFTFENDYLLNNYKIYNQEIVNLSCISKQFYQIISRNISYKLYCENRLDEWIFELYSKVGSRFYNIINNDSLGDLSINTITFDSFNDYKKYIDKIQNNSKYNNSDNNSGDKIKNIVIKLYDRDKCYSQVCKIAELNNEIPSNVKFKLRLDLSMKMFKIDPISLFYKFLNISNIKDIYIYYSHIKNEYFNTLKLFKYQNLESVMLDSLIFQTNWFNEITFSTNLKKLLITLPFHDIIRAMKLSEEDFIQRRFKCSDIETTILNANTIKQDWDLMIKKFKQNSTLTDLTICCYCISTCSYETSNINTFSDIITNDIKSILTSPNTSIKYLNLINFDLIDTNICQGISDNKTIKSLEISTQDINQYLEDILLSVYKNKNIIHLKFGYINLDLLYSILSSNFKKDPFYLESITFNIFTTRIKDLLTLLNYDKCNIKEYNLLILKTKFNLQNQDFKSIFNFKEKRSFKYNNKIINIDLI